MERRATESCRRVRFQGALQRAVKQAVDDPGRARIQRRGGVRGARAGGVGRVQDAWRLGLARGLG